MKLHSNKPCHVMKTQILKINLGASRKSQLEQGYFDGRFVQRAQQSKKVYTRKQKHQKTNYE
jgi:hypothetical protein